MMKSMKKTWWHRSYLLILLLLTLSILVLASCSKNSKQESNEIKGTDTANTATNESSGDDTEETSETNTQSVSEEPEGFEKTTLVISNTTADAGSKNVEITISIKKNPCILGMDFDIYYDQSAMTLVNAVSEITAEGCNFTPPAYYRNPTTFLWDFQDATWSGDGVILKLYFDITEHAMPGDYEIGIMYSYGNIFDADMSSVEVDVRNANIRIEA